jgi:hypothetical protein
VLSAGDVLRAMVDMFNTGDLGRLDEVVDPQYLDHQGLRGRPMCGPDGFATVVRAARSGYERLDVRIDDVIQGDDRAAARLSWRGVRASGESVSRETLEIVRTERGRAIEHWGAHS